MGKNVTTETFPIWAIGQDGALFLVSANRDSAQHQHRTEQHSER